MSAVRLAGTKPADSEAQRRMMCRICSGRKVPGVTITREAACEICRSGVKAMDERPHAPSQPDEGRCAVCGQYLRKPRGLADRFVTALMAGKESTVGDKAETTETPETGEKCGEPAMAMDWIGAATTWDEAEANMAAQHQAHELDEKAQQFQQLMNNILWRADLTGAQRATLLQEAAAGYAQRVAAPAEEPMGGMRERIGRLFGRKAQSKTEDGQEFHAGDYAAGDPADPTSWKLRLGGSPGTIDMEHVSGAIQALSPKGFRGQKVELEGGQRAQAIRKIGAAINRLDADDTAKDRLRERLSALKALGEPAREGAVKLLRGKAGTPERFIMWASNQFRDREGEIVSEKALRDWIERAEKSGRLPKANIWHVTPGTDWGEADVVDYVDGFLFVTGTITDPMMAERVAAWATKERLGTSIEYTYWRSDLEAGVYNALDIERVSVLPAERAANPWAPGDAVTLMEGGKMGFSEPKRKAMVELVGEDQTAALEADAAKAAEDLKAKGVAFKEAGEVQPVNIPLGTARVEFVLATKDEPAPAAEAAPAVTPVASPAIDLTPITAALTTLTELVTGLTGRLDQTDAAVKALSDGPPAMGVLGRSVQHGAQTVMDRAMSAIKEDAGEKPDGGIAAEFADAILGGGKTNGAAAS